MYLRLASLISRAGIYVIDALVSYLARPVRDARQARSVDSLSLSGVLREGDVLLTSGNTRAARLVRLITRSPWAHVCVYVGPLSDEADPPCIVEADLAAGVRAIRLSELVGQQVQVLRATQLAEPDRLRLVAWVTSHIGDRYDIASACALAARLLKFPRMARRNPADAAAEANKRFFCSSLVAQAFLLVGLHVLPAHVQARAVAPDHRFVTPRDFAKASGFEVIG